MTDIKRKRLIGKMLTVDASQLEAIAQELAGTDAEVKTALKRAINRTVMWMKTRAKQALSKGLKIPSRIIQARLRHSLFTGEITSADTRLARIWVGLNPISAARLKPKQNKRGVTAGGELFPGAFMATGRSGNRHVYRRMGKSRLPIESVYKDIQHGQEIIENQVFEGWEEFLYQRFEHELKWQSRNR